jgi:hypothetical protein
MECNSAANDTNAEQVSPSPLNGERGGVGGGHGHG